jgi:restriction endonuclease S subunit
MSFKLSIGRIAVAGRDLFPNEAIAWIEPRDGDVLIPFLSAALQAQDLALFAGRAVKGATLNSDSLASIQVAVPPLPEQQRIVDLMGAVDAYVAAADARVEAARTARTALLTDLLSTPGEDWVETSIGEVANWHGGITPSMSEPRYWTGGTVPWISSGDVVDHTLATTSKSVTAEALDETGLKRVSPGSVVMVVRSGILVRKLPISFVPFETTVNQDIKVATPSADCCGKFLALWLEAHAQEILSEYRKTGTTVASINSEALFRKTFFLPSLREQGQIAKLALESEAVIKCSADVAASARHHRTALLTDLLSGTHEIPASYDRFLEAV